MSIDYEEDGMYIGEMNGDFYLFTVKGISEDMTFKQYDRFIHNHTMIAYPLNKNYFPLQQVSLSSFNDSKHLNPILDAIIRENDSDAVRTWITWIGVDWYKITQRWREEKLTDIWYYIVILEKEVIDQMPS